MNTPIMKAYEIFYFAPEVYECFGYRRTLQVIINRIGYGDLH